MYNETKNANDKLYTEEYILANLHSINNLCYIVVNNKYSEKFMEEIINYLDIKELVRKNYLSDNFLQNNVYPFMDDHEISRMNILNFVDGQRKSLLSAKKLNFEDKKKYIQNLNKIDQSLIDLIMSD